MPNKLLLAIALLATRCPAAPPSVGPICREHFRLLENSRAANVGNSPQTRGAQILAMLEGLLTKERDEAKIPDDGAPAFGAAPFVVAASGDGHAWEFTSNRHLHQPTTAAPGYYPALQERLAFLKEKVDHARDVELRVVTDPAEIKRLLEDPTYRIKSPAENRPHRRTILGTFLGAAVGLVAAPLATWRFTSQRGPQALEPITAEMRKTVVGSREEHIRLVEEFLKHQEAFVKETGEDHIRRVHADYILRLRRHLAAVKRPDADGAARKFGARRRDYVDLYRIFDVDGGFEDGTKLTQTLDAMTNRGPEVLSAENLSKAAWLWGTKQKEADLRADKDYPLLALFSPAELEDAHRRLSDAAYSQLAWAGELPLYAVAAAGAGAAGGAALDRRRARAEGAYVPAPAVPELASLRDAAGRIGGDDREAWHWVGTRKKNGECTDVILHVDNRLDHTPSLVIARYVMPDAKWTVRDDGVANWRARREEAARAAIVKPPPPRRRYFTETQLQPLRDRLEATCFAGPDSDVAPLNKLFRSLQTVEYSEPQIEQIKAVLGRVNNAKDLEAARRTIDGLPNIR